MNHGSTRCKAMQSQQMYQSTAVKNQGFKNKLNAILNWHSHHYTTYTAFLVSHQASTYQASSFLSHTSADTESHTCRKSVEQNVSRLFLKIMNI
jgi:hypothetical protein